MFPAFPRPSRDRAGRAVPPADEALARLPLFAGTFISIPLLDSSADPPLTMESPRREPGARKHRPVQESPGICSRCGGPLRASMDTAGRADVRGENAGEAEDDADLDPPSRSLPFIHDEQLDIFDLLSESD